MWPHRARALRCTWRAAIDIGTVVLTPSMSPDRRAPTRADLLVGESTLTNAVPELTCSSKTNTPPPGARAPRAPPLATAAAIERDSEKASCRVVSIVCSYSTTVSRTAKASLAELQIDRSIGGAWSSVSIIVTQRRIVRSRADGDRAIHGVVARRRRNTAALVRASCALVAPHTLCG